MISFGTNGLLLFPKCSICQDYYPATILFLFKKSHNYLKLQKKLIQFNEWELFIDKVNSNEIYKNLKLGFTI
jgi:hypothetical protein